MSPVMNVNDSITPMKRLSSPLAGPLHWRENILVYDAVLQRHLSFVYDAVFQRHLSFVYDAVFQTPVICIWSCVTETTVICIWCCVTKTTVICIWNCVPETPVICIWCCVTETPVTTFFMTEESKDVGCRFPKKWWYLDGYHIPEDYNCKNN
jgi:hypothetical protein